jgi:hypothetical protein
MMRERALSLDPRVTCRTQCDVSPWRSGERYEMSYATQYSGLNNAGTGGGDISESVETIAGSRGVAMSAAPGGLPNTLSCAIKKLSEVTVTTRLDQTLSHT